MTITTPDRASFDQDRYPNDWQRECTLRNLLSLAAANELPLPASIEFHSFVSAGETLRVLHLHLDDNSRTDVNRWGEAIGAEVTEMDVIARVDQWTVVTAQTPWRDEPGIDWHQIQIDSRCDRHALAAATTA